MDYWLLPTYVHLFSLHIILQCFQIISGMTTLAISSLKPLAGDDVNLTCTTLAPPDVEDKWKCHFTWDFASFHGAINALKQDNAQIFTFSDDYNHTESSVLALYNVDRNYEGDYRCHSSCDPGDINDNIGIRLTLGVQESSSNSVFGVTIGALTVGMIVIVAIVIGISECVQRKRAQARALRHRPSTASQTRPSPCSEDLPPTYADCMGTCLSSDVYIIPVPPPPAYEDAILDLANKGIIFNANSIGDMPPGYSNT